MSIKRGPGFNSRPRHLNFPRLVISCFQVAIWLKYRCSDVNPQYNQPTYVAKIGKIDHDIKYLLPYSVIFDRKDQASGGREDTKAKGGGRRWVQQEHY